MVVTLLTAVPGYLTRSNLEEEEYLLVYSFKRFIPVSNVWQLEGEVAGHIVSTVRKQRVDKMYGLSYKTSRPTASDLHPPVRF